MEKMKIMLVDDEERFLATTKKLLEKRGYRVFTAASGAKALEKLGTELIHVVILDVKMPGMDGLTCLRQIKSLFPMVEVILLTGHATAESAVEGMESGATDYLMKPIDIDELMDKSEEAAKKRQRLEERIRVAQARTNEVSGIDSQ